jgi:hypothetical protein
LKPLLLSILKHHTQFNKSKLKYPKFKYRKLTKMDANTAGVIERSVNKLYYLGIGFGILIGGKLILDVVKELKSSNSKTNSSRPVRKDDDDEREERRSTRRRNKSRTSDSPGKGVLKKKVSFVDSASSEGNVEKIKPVHEKMKGKSTVIEEHNSLEG